MDSVTKHPTKEQQAIERLLNQWCDPKPQYSGISAWELAGRVLQVIAETRTA